MNCEFLFLSTDGITFFLYSGGLYYRRRVCCLFLNAFSSTCIAAAPGTPEVHERAAQKLPAAE